LLPFLITTVLAADARWGHSSTIVNRKLYIFGGYTSAGQSSYSSQQLILDLQQPFSTKSPPYQDVSTSSPPKIALHSAAAHGSDLLVYGGNNGDNAPNSVYFYSSSKNSWSNNSPKSDPGPRRLGTTLTAYEWGPDTAWLFGGFSDNSTSAPNALNQNTSVAHYELYSINPGDSTFDAHDYTAKWPAGRANHAAAMLDNGNIVYIGGQQSSGLVPMNEIYIFSTQDSGWAVRLAGGNIPLPRILHSAVAKGRYVYMYGGTDAGRSTAYADIGILDTLTWTWTVAIPGNNIAGRYGHGANMVGGNLMMITNGITGGNPDASIYVLNTDTMQFTESYVPNFSGTGTGGGVGRAPNATNIGAIIGGVVGGLAGLAIIGVAAFLFWKRRQATEKQFQHKPVRDAVLVDERPINGQPKPVVVPVEPAVVTHEAQQDDFLTHLNEDDYIPATTVAARARPPSFASARVAGGGGASTIRSGANNSTITE
jgi:hypothetical protein